MYWFHSVLWRRHLWIAALAGWAWVAVGGLLVVLVQDNDAAALIRGIVLQVRAAGPNQAVDCVVRESLM